MARVDRSEIPQKMRYYVGADITLVVLLGVGQFGSILICFMSGLLRLRPFGV
jgi:hypothetical protein